MKTKHLVGLALSLCILAATVSCMLFTPSGSELKFDPDKLPDAQVGASYDVKIHVSQNRTPVGDFSISDGTLPAGLKLEKAEDTEDTARITGVPTQAGNFTFKIGVWCYGTNVAGQTGEKEYSIVVSRP